MFTVSEVRVGEIRGQILRVKAQKIVPRRLLNRREV
jgi:hypothetical protein